MKLTKETLKRIIKEEMRKVLNEGSESPELAQLKPMGFYFAGIGTNIVGDLDRISSKKFEHKYPDESYEDGPFHLQVSHEEDGTFKIHNYTQVIPEFCSNWPETRGVSFRSIEEVKAAIEQMVIGYEEFMEAYQYAYEVGAISDPYWPTMDKDHPKIQHLKKR